MTQDMETYILSAVFFLILCAAFFFWKRRKQTPQKAAKKNYVLETLELAKSQYEIFNIKMAHEETPTSFSGLAEALDLAHIALEITGAVPNAWLGKQVNVFFHAKRPEGPIFYTFDSVIREVKSEGANSRIVLTLPTHLRVEKKRHFDRVKPDQNQIRVIGLWPMKPGKRLPQSTSEIGAPAVHYKPGMADAPVRIENISGAGLALKLKKDPGTEALNLKKGAQLFCLVVYILGEGQAPIAFWSTCEVMNIREENGPSPAVIIGLEFTNWAVLEQASNEIHWAHSSPSRGARPMLQWVENIEARNGDKKVPAAPKSGGQAPGAQQAGPEPEKTDLE